MTSMMHDAEAFSDMAAYSPRPIDSLATPDKTVERNRELRPRRGACATEAVGIAAVNRDTP